MDKYRHEIALDSIRWDKSKKQWVVCFNVTVVVNYWGILPEYCVPVKSLSSNCLSLSRIVRGALDILLENIMRHPEVLKRAPRRDFQTLERDSFQFDLPFPYP